MYMNGYPAYPYGAAPQIRTRRNYVLHVAADSSTFTLIHGCLNNCNCGAIASLS